MVERLHGNAGSKTRDALLEAWARQLGEAAVEGGVPVAPVVSPAVAGAGEAPAEVSGGNALRDAGREDAFVTGEQAELDADAARLFRGRVEAPKAPLDAKGTTGAELRAIEARANARRVSPKSGTKSGGRHPHLGPRAARAQESALPHPGNFVAPTSGAQLLGAKQTTPHRPSVGPSNGAVVIA